LGAHTIGMAEKKNSGFDGHWTPDEESVFNVTYYEAMIDPTLKWHNKVKTREDSLNGKVQYS